MMNNPKNRTIGLVRREESDDWEEPQPKIYPFYLKFTEGKTKSLWQPVDNNNLPCSKQTQPFITEPETSQIYKDDSFQSYHTSQQTFRVQQELSQSQIILPKQQQQPQVEDKHDEQPILSREAEADDYSHLSESHLRVLNYKIVRRKQELRRMITQLRKNVSILSEQDTELQRLRELRQKALDYNYEFRLEQASSRKKSHSHLVEQAIENMSNMLKKQRYQRLKEFHQSKDPNDPRRLMSDSRATQIQHHLPQMLSRREEMLCQRRREEKYASVLEGLIKKKAELQEINCIFDSRVCMGDEPSLSKRKQQLKKLIECRLLDQRSQQEQLSLQIVDIKSQLQAVQLKIIMADVQLRNDYDQRPLKSNYLTKLRRKQRCNNSEFAKRIQGIYCVSPISSKVKTSIKIASKESNSRGSPFISRKGVYRLVSQQVSQRQHTTN